MNNVISPLFFDVYSLIRRKRKCGKRNFDMILWLQNKEGRKFFNTEPNTMTYKLLDQIIFIQNYSTVYLYTIHTQQRYYQKECIIFPLKVFYNKLPVHSRICKIQISSLTNSYNQQDPPGIVFISGSAHAVHLTIVYIITKKVIFEITQYVYICKQKLQLSFHIHFSLNKIFDKELHVPHY